MTEMPIEHAAHEAASGGAHAAPPQPPAPANGLSRWGRVHADLTGFGHALLEMAGLTGRIVADPQVEKAINAILTMAGLGAEAHEFQAIIDLAEAAIGRRQPPGTVTGPVPYFSVAPVPPIIVGGQLPAPADGSEAM